MKKVIEAAIPVAVVACIGIVCFTYYKITEIKWSGGLSRIVDQNTVHIHDLSKVVLDLAKEVKSLQERP